MTRSGWVCAILTSLIAAPPANAERCDLANAPGVPVIKGLPYQQARQAILAARWTPVPGSPHNDFSNNEGLFRDRGYTELQFCRTSGDSPCRFKFASGTGYALWVTTAGEENAALGSVAAVKAARLTCAADADPG